ASVVVDAVEANAPQLHGDATAGAIVPPPAVTAHTTGAPVSLVPRCVLSDTPGLHSGSSVPPTTVATSVHVPATTASDGPVGTRLADDGAGLLWPVPGLRTRGTWNSPAVPPT